MFSMFDTPHHNCEMDSELPYLLIILLIPPQTFKTPKSQLMLFYTQRN